MLNVLANKSQKYKKDLIYANLNENYCFLHRKYVFFCLFQKNTLPLRENCEELRKSCGNKQIRYNYGKRKLLAKNP